MPTIPGEEEMPCRAEGKDVVVVHVVVVVMVCYKPDAGALILHVLLSPPHGMAPRVGEDSAPSTVHTEYCRAITRAVSRLLRLSSLYFVYIVPLHPNLLQFGFRDR
jgi:hypothetical protein